MDAELRQAACRLVPFPVAARWAGVPLGDGAASRGTKTWCPFGVYHSDGGRDRALRVYPDHAWCFSEKRHFTTVTLLAAVWEVSADEAAALALARAGHARPGFRSRWEAALAAPRPDRDALAGALAQWCRSRDPHWTVRQYEPAVAGRLSRCLALLPLVTSEDDCRRWLDASCRSMTPLLDACQGHT